MQYLEQVLDSREVAQMVDKEHHKLLRDIRTYTQQLTESKIGFSDFFTESNYKDSTGRTLPCYLVTKKGREFIAHKITGVKGAKFTALYINRFHEMEEQLQRENHMDWFVNDIRVFQHREFGILRTLKLENQDYFIGKDITTPLGYVNNTDTLKKRVSNAEKCYVAICDGNRSRKMIAITLKGLDELIRTGRLPLASKYNEWIYGQVLPALTGKMIKAEQTPVMLPSTKMQSKNKDPLDIAPLFRELLPTLPIEVLDEMEKALRESKSPAINLIVTAILSEKIRRQNVVREDMAYEG